jgi:hypothetical protein
MDDKRAKPVIPPFEIDSRLNIKIHPELANAMATLILSTDTKNQALLAMAHQIKNRAKELNLQKDQSID